MNYNKKLNILYEKKQLKIIFLFMLNQRKIKIKDIFHHQKLIKFEIYKRPEIV